MIIAGALDENRSNPFVITQSSRLPEIPVAESTRVPLKPLQIEEVREKEEPLIPDGLLEKNKPTLIEKN